MLHRSSIIIPEVEPAGTEHPIPRRHEVFESVVKFELDKLAVKLAHVHQDIVQGVQGDISAELIGGVARAHSFHTGSSSRSVARGHAFRARSELGKAAASPASEDEDGLSSEDSGRYHVHEPPDLSKEPSGASKCRAEVSVVSDLVSGECSRRRESHSATTPGCKQRDSIPSNATSFCSLLPKAGDTGGHLPLMVGAPDCSPNANANRNYASSQSIIEVDEDFLNRQQQACASTSDVATRRATVQTTANGRRESNASKSVFASRNSGPASRRASSLSFASSRASFSKSMRRGSGNLSRGRVSQISEFSELSAHEWIKGMWRGLQDSLGAHHDKADDELATATRFEACMEMVITGPGSLRHCLWESLAILIVLCEVIVLPLQLIEPPRDSYLNVGCDSYWPNIRTIVACFWTLNLPVAFTTGIMNAQGEIFMLPGPIALYYAKSWMGLDLLTVTLDWLDVAGALVGSWLGVARLIRMLRGVRLVHALASQELARPLARSEMLRLVATIVTLMATMAWTTHVIGCFFYYVGTQPNQETEGWVAQTGADDMSLGDRYTWCLHCALGLFVGEHIVLPNSHVERAFTVGVLFFAFIVSASFVSSLTTAMTRLHLITSQRSKQRIRLNRYLIENKISQQLSLKVRRNAQHAAEQLSKRTPEESVELLTFVSEPLRQEINFEIFGKVLFAHPFFEFYGDMHPVAIRKICHVAVKRISFSRGDVVFSDQEVPAEPRMYFVLTGCLEYSQMRSGLLEVAKIIAGNWLCEAVLWAKWKHCGTATATCETDVCALSTVGFHMVVGEFPHAELHAYARSFIDAIRQTGKRLTDVSLPTSKLTLLAGAAFADGFGATDSDRDGQPPRPNHRPQVPQAPPQAPASIMPEQVLVRDDEEASHHSKESPIMRVDSWRADSS